MLASGTGAAGGAAGGVALVRVVCPLVHAKAMKLARLVVFLHLWQRVHLA